MNAQDDTEARAEARLIQCRHNGHSINRVVRLECDSCGRVWTVIPERVPGQP